MNTKEKLALLLRENTDRYLSGEAIAKELGISRTAVWKAINSLRREGFEIASSTNKGYRISRDSGALTPEGIGRYLPEKHPEIFVYGTIGSTNTKARELAQCGASEGTIVAASHQTDGRGRMGRNFFSPDDTGLYMSIVLRPDMSAEASTLITTAAAVAVCRAIEELCQKKALIKWVNDILVDGRKVCGILTEASLGMESGSLEYAILGIGVNLYLPEGGFPENIRESAGYIFDEKTSGMRAVLCARIWEKFFEIYKDLGDKAFLGEYADRSFVIGRRIDVVSPSGRRSAVALSVDEDCRLEVRFDDGEVKKLSTGEISIRL